MDRVLLIDDDEEMCGMLEEYLRSEGFAVETVHNGEDGLTRALSGEHSVIVLDVMLPGMNGIEVLRRLRSESDARVLMLTARGEEVDKIVGFEVGADDYVPKPFSPRELLVRIRAILRRPGSNGKPERIMLDDLELNTGNRSLRKGGREVELTALEFNLLELLLRSAGRVVTREQVTKLVLGRQFSASDRSIDVHVSKLRRKLGERIPGEDRIKAIRSVGYIYTIAHEDENQN